MHTYPTPLLYVIHNMKPYSQPQIYTDIYSYAKIYPQLTRLFIYDTPLTVRTTGFEERDRKLKGPINKNPSSPIESMRRTKTTIADLTLCNQFDLFATFTFSKDRQNVELLKKRMSTWLKNQKKIHGKFQYLIVPEYHKDGKSIHFHALLKNYNGNLIKAKTKHKNRNVYNITSYNSGFSTAKKIDNHNKVSSYIRKYITKEMPKFEGKKRYWLSTGLIRPYKIPNPIYTKEDLKQFDLKYSFENVSVYEKPYCRKNNNKQNLPTSRETDNIPTLTKQETIWRTPLPTLTRS